jgi:hypothetical protein
MNKKGKIYLKVKFLELYSLYLSGEKIKEQEIRENKDEKISNREIKKIYNELKEIKEKDSYLNYLFGIILKEINRKEESIEYFIQSINENEYLWSSWMELISITNEKEVVIF